MSGRPLPKSRSRAAQVTSVVLSALPWVGLAAMTGLWARAARKPKPGLSEQVATTPERFEAAEPGRGRLAEAPHKIPPRGWRDIVWRTWLEIGRDRLPAVAGGITFYSLLAIFPAIGVFVSLYGLFADVDQVSKHLDQLAGFVPQEILSLLGDQMVRLASQRHASLSVAFVVSLLLSVWSANTGMQSLIDGLNVAYDETEKRNFLVRRVLTYGFTFAALVFLTAVTGILVALPIVAEALEIWDWWVIPVRWLALLALAGGGFAAIYRFGPSREMARWRWVGWGATFAALAWVVGSLGYSWFLNHVAHYDVTYGSLGAVVGFMMWIWFSTMMVLVGAELNAEIEHQTARDSTTGAPLPMGARGAAMADTVGLPFEGVRRLWGSAEARLGKLVGGRPTAAAPPPAGKDRVSRTRPQAPTASPPGLRR
ncbi:MAG TPA: YihY/virulence factor BrkB family protein [Phenylobacterium sp.]